MRKNTPPTLLLLSLSLSIGLVAAKWNILTLVNNINKATKRVEKVDNSFVVESLDEYCESWRLNVELNNIRGFDVIPSECSSYIGDYMNSEQYKVDIQRASEEVNLFISTNFEFSDEGKDAFIFDIDEVILSNIPFYTKYDYGGVKVEKSEFEEWLSEAKAPAIEPIKHLFHMIRIQGLKVFIISSRPENLREATIQNLFDVGYHGWTQLILRSPDDNHESAEKYKAEKRAKLVDEGYIIWGIVGSQWSSLGGHTSAKRNFKLPNPMYYQY